MRPIRRYEPRLRGLLQTFGCVHSHPSIPGSLCIYVRRYASVSLGSYTGSASPYGTYDQGGNVQEWTDTLMIGNRILRGGEYENGAGDLSVTIRGSGSPVNEAPWIGFRVASTVPEPGTGALVIAGLLGFASRRRART